MAAGGDTGDAHDLMRLGTRVRNVVWLFTVVLLGAALLGAFGDGPLAKASAEGSGGVRVHFERILRHAASSELVLEIPAALADGDRVRVTLDHAFLHAVDHLVLSPSPLESVAGEHATTMVFRVAPNGARVRLRIAFEPRRTGRLDPAIAVGSSAPVDLRQWVLP